MTSCTYIEGEPRGENLGTRHFIHPFLLTAIFGHGRRIIMLCNILMKLYIMFHDKDKEYIFQVDNSAQHFDNLKAFWEGVFQSSPDLHYHFNSPGLNS